MFSGLKRFLGGNEEKEGRQAPRVQPSGICHVTIDGKQIPLKNWSAVGILAAPYSGSLVPKQRFRLAVKVKQDHFDFDFDAEAIVVRIDQSGIAARFVFLNPALKKRIDEYFAYYTGGKS
jgi:hypothetical protein